MGTTYVWQVGEMTCKNLRTGDIATLDFLDKGWTSTDDFKCNGVIKDSKGKVWYTVEGLWDRYLKATSTATGKTTVLLEKKPGPEKQDWQYLFPTFSINLNYLNKDLFQKIAPTDSRLRPDQRAYEYGDVKIAASEKLRLEEKQRLKRKNRETNGVLTKPQWFVEDKDPVTQEMYYKYIGDYWERRLTGDWPSSTEDIY